MAAKAGARRGLPARASSPGGASSDSLPTRSVNANMAVDNAFNMTRPPRLSTADSVRISITRHCSCAPIAGRSALAPRSGARTTPLIFWLHPALGIRGASWFLGVAEWLFGALLLLGFWNKRLGILGALGSTVTFILTVTII